MMEWLLYAAIAGMVGAVAYGVGGTVTGAAGRRLRTRLDALSDPNESEESISAIRARYLRQLSPLERMLEELPGMERLRHMGEQAGWKSPAYRLAAASLGLAVLGAIIAAVVTRNALITLAVAAVFGAVPFIKLMRDRGERLDKFEQQLPDALDLMARSLRAGNPLMESFKFVSDEMKPPVSTEFGRAWSNINYGVSLRVSLFDFVDRTPSVSLRSLTTAILVQRETGGNLAEILDKLTQLMRSRVKFQRKLKSLTAEGRMSGYILCGMPFGMAGLLSFASPTYLPMLIGDPAGKKLITVALVGMVVGIFWVSRIVKIKV
jgi:tight adherence protein B